jgi:hypothetical protein
MKRVSQVLKNTTTHDTPIRSWLMVYQCVDKLHIFYPPVYMQASKVTTETNYRDLCIVKRTLRTINEHSLMSSSEVEATTLEMQFRKNLFHINNSSALYGYRKSSWLLFYEIWWLFSLNIFLSEYTFTNMLLVHSIHSEPKKWNDALAYPMNISTKPSFEKKLWHVHLNDIWGDMRYSGPNRYDCRRTLM